MARKEKSVYDQLRSEIADLKLKNANMVVENIKYKTLLSAIGVVALERTGWLLESNSEIKWVMTFHYDESRDVLDPYFRFFDSTDELLYKTKFTNSILEEAVRRLP
jgi:hypothetical protein